MSDPSDTSNEFSLYIRNKQTLTLIKRVFITNVKGTFFGMSESAEASKGR
jgi:hypothetical protein